jgi:autotransporter-associated beta strand protein
MDLNLTSLVSSPYTIVVVEGRSSNKIDNYLLGSGTGANDQALHFGYRNDTAFTLAQYANDLDGTVAAFTSQQFNIMAGVLDTATGHTLYRNGMLLNSNTNVTPFSASANGVVGRGFGGDRYYQGDLAEILIYPYALSAGQLQRVQDYLNSKWLGGGGVSFIPDASPVTLDAVATLDLNGQNETIGSLASAAGTSSVTLGSGTLTLAPTAGSTTFAGVISGTGNLVHNGAVGATHVLSGANTYSGNTTVSGGTLVAQQGVNGGPTTATTSVTASGAKLEAKHIRQAVLSVAAGATAEITVNPTPTNKAATVSVLTSALAAPNNSLQIAAGGALDLNNNDLIMYYAPGTGATALSAIQQYVYDGFLNTPSVPQIKFDTTFGTYQTYAVAFDNGALLTPWTSWDSQPLSGKDQIIVKYTYRGDLDLDGDVDGNDFTVVQMNFGTTGLGLGKGWMKGDADLNGTVDGNDFTVIQQNFGAGSGGPLAPPAGNVVPEPSTLALVLLAGGAALAAALRGLWRRKR